MKFFTIGYEKRGIDDFIDTLHRNEIKILVDIRAVPHSRNKDFTKRNLERHLLENGIGYILKKELGSPRELREKVKADGDYESFFLEYDRLLGDKIGLIRGLADIAKTSRICLLCYEADADRCHRSSVARELERLERNFEITNL